MKTNEQEFTSLINLLSSPESCEPQQKSDVLATLILSLDESEAPNIKAILIQFIVNFDLKTIGYLAKHQEASKKIQKYLTWHDIFDYQHIGRVSFKKFDLILEEFEANEFALAAQKQSDITKFYLFFNHALQKGYQLTQNDWTTLGERLTICFKKNTHYNGTDYIDLFLNAYFSNTQVNIQSLLEQYFDGFMSFYSEYSPHKKYKNFIKINHKKTVLSVDTLNTFYESFDSPFEFKLSTKLLLELSHSLATYINDQKIESSILNMLHFLENKKELVDLLMAKNAKAKKFVPIVEKMMLEKHIKDHDNKTVRIKI